MTVRFVHSYNIGRTHVDIWKVPLEEPSSADDDTSDLSSDEIGRSKRFLFDEDRVHFIRCHLALRDVLAGYLAISASEIRFVCSTTGKPQIAAEQNSRALSFNLSHSAGMALIAVGGKRPLGIDIEKIRYDVDTFSLAERFFSPRECAGLRALPELIRVRAFFACWTRKEAFVKATGEGLSFPLDDFSVTTHPDLSPEVEEIRGNMGAHEQWLLADVHVGNGYRAALAVDNRL